APVAAPTTSLPEALGGERNWDYRYAWPRDASVGIAAFLGTAKVDEARGFMAWLLHASRLDRPRVPVLLTLDGRPAPPHRQQADLSARRRRRWIRARDAIFHDVTTRGVDRRRDIYTRAYGSEDLDAAVLLLPIVGIEDDESPRVRRTVDAIRRELSAGGPLLH